MPLRVLPPRVEPGTLLGDARAGDAQTITTLYTASPTAITGLFLPELLIPTERRVLLRAVVPVLMGAINHDFGLGIFEGATELNRYYGPKNASIFHGLGAVLEAVIGPGDGVTPRSFDVRLGPVTATGSATTNVVGSLNIWATFTAMVA
jgi:hypothetical protein